MANFSLRPSMRRSSPARYRYDVGHIVNKLLECDEPSTLLDNVVEPMCKLVGGSSAAFGHWCYEANRLEPLANDALAALSGTYALDNSLNVLYAQGFFRDDPVFRAIEARHFGRGRQRRAELVQLEQVAVREEMPRSAFFQDFLIRAGIRDVLAIAVRPLIDRGDIFIIGFHRDRRADPFDEADAERLQPLAPALASVISRLVLQADARMLQGISEDLSTAQGLQPCLLLDNTLRILWLNQSAREALALRGNPPCGDLLETLRAECAALPADQAHASFLISPDLSAAITRKPNGRTLILLDRLMSDQSVAVRAGKLGLSRREAEVAQQVYDGFTSAQIGARMGISERTVNNHLRSAYRKLGIHNRTSFINRLLAPD